MTLFGSLPAESELTFIGHQSLGKPVQLPAELRRLPLTSACGT